jgi:hypothetical protein
VGTQVEDAGPPSRARAGTLVVIGTMAAIAVVSVTAVVAWARLGQPGRAGEAGAVDEVPTVLADGNPPQPVPDAVAGAVDGPVVGAAKLDRLPDDMLSACMEHADVAWDTGSPDVEYAFITTDAMTAALTGTADVGGEFGRGPEGAPASSLRLRCDLDLEGSTVVNRGGGSFEEIFPGNPPHTGGWVSSSCCDRNGLATASAAIAVPDGAEWALQDRGTWFLAYEVDGMAQAPVTWKYRERRMGPGGPPASLVIFVNADGNVVGEDTAGGQF